MYYIQEIDKPNLICRMFNIIQLKDDKIILPINKEEISEKQAEKLAKKTKAILDKTSCKKVVLSKQIKKYEKYENYLNSFQIEVIKGKWLFEVLSTKVLEKTLEKENIKKEETRNSYSN